MKMYWYVKNPNTNTWHIAETISTQYIKKALCGKKLEPYWETAYLKIHPRNTCGLCLYHIEKQAQTQ